MWWRCCRQWQRASTYCYKVTHVIHSHIFRRVIVAVRGRGSRRRLLGVRHGAVCVLVAATLCNRGAVPLGPRGCLVKEAASVGMLV